MAQEYTVTRISQQPPREYDGDYGKVYYIKTQLEGHDKPVSIGKKDPHALRAGDKVYGRIIETQYDEDKFQAERRDNNHVGNKGSFNGNKGHYQPRDDAAIRAQFAIKAAIEYCKTNDPNSLNDVEEYARRFYAMVDSVKGGLKGNTPLRDGFNKAKEEVHEVPAAVLDGSAPIDLDDIPF